MDRPPLTTDAPRFVFGHCGEYGRRGAGGAQRSQRQGDRAQGAPSGAERAGGGRGRAAVVFCAGSKSLSRAMRYIII